MNIYSKRITKRKYEFIEHEPEPFVIQTDENKNINKYIYILYSICNDTNNHHIVDFYDKGGFVIKDMELFKNLIIQKYKLNDYHSFIRNLNNYGFVNITPRNKYDKQFFNNINIYYINEIIYANPFFLNNLNQLYKLSELKYKNFHLKKNTFMKDIKNLHSIETIEIINILLSIKNNINIKFI